MLEKIKSIKKPVKFIMHFEENIQSILVCVLSSARASVFLLC